MFHWPIPDDHIIYIGGKRSLKSSEDTKELLGLVENSNLCEGLPQDDNTKSVVVDPTWEQGQGLSDFPKSTVSCHSVPKSFCESHFKSSVTFRSLNCEVILDNTSPKQGWCNPCSLAINSLKKAATRKKKVSSIPAKSKASLAACGPETLVATAKASRLECKS